MNYVNTNRINNFIYMYNIQNTKENFKKLEHVIEKEVLLYTNKFYIWSIIVELCKKIRRE